MRHFEACEACGRSDLLTQGGFCYECNQKADRRPIVRLETVDDGRIRTVLAKTPRPLPEVVDA